MRTPWTRCSASTSRCAASSAGEVVGVAEDHRQARGVGRLLDAARDVGEERVGDVEHDQADGAAVPGPQVPGRLVADEARASAIASLDPLAGAGADRVGPVEHVADGADRDAGPLGDVPDAAGQRSSSARGPRRAPVGAW